MSRNSAELVAQAEKAGKMAGGAMLIRHRGEDDSEPEARLKASSPGRTAGPTFKLRRR